MSLIDPKRRAVLFLVHCRPSLVFSITQRTISDVDMRLVLVQYSRVDMTYPLYQFRWTFPDAGYEVITQKDQRFLAERMDLANRSVWKCAPLQEETGLFKEFAALYPVTDEKVLAFANRHGWLGVERPRVDRVYPKSELPGSCLSWASGEPLRIWHYHIERMHHLVTLWQAAADGDQSVLSDYIKWTSDPDTERLTAVSYHEPTSGLGPIEPTQGSRLIAAEFHRSEVFDDFRQGDHVGPALHALQQAINKIFEDHPSNSRLLWDQNFERMGLYLAPTSLLGALWLQFAQAIEGNKQYRQCEQCRRWFEIGAQVREDAKFCKQACRSKSYRERKKEARQLHESGLSLKEIAKRFDTKVITVKGWIKQ